MKSQLSGFMFSEAIASDSLIKQHMVHVGAKSGESTFSDFSHYLTRRTGMLAVLKDVLFVILMLQWFVTSLCTTFREFWGVSVLMDNFLMYVGGVCLVNMPSVNSNAYSIVLSLTIGLVCLEFVVSQSARYRYSRKRHLHIATCYISTYLSLAMYTVFFPAICACLGRYISATFVEELQTNSAVGVVAVIVMVYVLMNAINFHLFRNHSVLFAETLFVTWRLDVGLRLYMSLGVMIFVTHIAPDHSRNMVVLPVLMCVVNLGNVIIEMMNVNWAILWQFTMTCSVILASLTADIIIMIDTVVLHWNNPALCLWITAIVFNVAWMLVPFYHKKVVFNALKDLSEPDYSARVKSARSAMRDLAIGFQYGHVQVMSSAHISDLLKRFPHNFSFYVFLARFSLECSSCPLAMDEIGQRLVPHEAFAPAQANVSMSLTRLMPPTSQLEIEEYDQMVVLIGQGLVKLLGAGCSIYGFILEELTAAIPVATLTFESLYDEVLRNIFSFVQRYPGSPKGEYFLNLLDNVFPGLQEMSELRRLHQYNNDYVKVAAALYPSHLNAQRKMSEVFRAYKPRYVNPVTMTVDPIAKEETESDEEKLSRAHGPFAHVMRKWWVCALIVAGFAYPLFFMPAVMSQNDRFLIRANHLIKAWSIEWRIQKVITDSYPAILYETARDWNMFQRENMTYHEYRTGVLDMIEELVTDLVYVATGYGSDDLVSTTVRSVLLDFFGRETTSPLLPGEFSYLHGVLSSTFIVQEILAVDSVWLLDRENVTYLIDVMHEISGVLREVFDDYATVVDDTDIFTENVVDVSPVYMLVVQEILLIGVMAVVAVAFYTAVFRSSIFFRTLRETSMAAVTLVRSYFNKQQSIIGPTQTSRRQQKREMFQYFVDFLIPFVIIGVLAFCVTIGQYVLYECMNKQIERILEFGKVFANSYTNASIIARNHQELFYSNIITNVDKESLSAEIESMTAAWMQNHDMWRDAGTIICPLCSLRSQLLQQTSSGSTYDKEFMGWLAQVSISWMPTLESGFSMEIIRNVSSDYYFVLEPLLREFNDLILKNTRSVVSTTWTCQLVLFVLYVVIIIVFGIFLVRTVARADAPFKQILILLRIIPEKSLSRGTLCVVKEYMWDFKIRGFDCDAAYYEEILSSLLDAVVVINDKRNIIWCNAEARKSFIDTSVVSGDDKGFFNCLQMDLVEVHEDGNAETDVGLQNIVSDYLFNDRSNVVTHRLMGKRGNQTYWYSLTILPVFDESPDQLLVQVQGADTFALIFRDIGEEIRAKNLLGEEAEKHMSILKQILPGDISTRLLNDKGSISMTVPKAAIAFCDIVQFTPWCSSQTPDVVVNTLNLMFKTFDEICSRYTHVTKIKGIGDCYMSAAGIFPQGADPVASAYQMIQFCLDSIDSMSDINAALNAHLRVRIGIAYGGPISAGVMGIEKPVFDIWGETVNDAQVMESSGQPMMVHISKDMYDVIKRAPFHFAVEDDGNVFVTRNPPAHAKPEEQD